MLHDNSRSLDHDSGPVVSRAHADTEDFDVQVMLDDGEFHREMDYTTTACDQPIPHVGQWRRIQQYEGNLCKRGCYSAPELARAEEANKRAKEERDAPILTSVSEAHQKKIDEWMEGVKNAAKPKKR